MQRGAPIFFLPECSRIRHLPRTSVYLWTTSRERKLKRSEGVRRDPDGSGILTGHNRPAAGRVAYVTGGECYHRGQPRTNPGRTLRVAVPAPLVTMMARLSGGCAVQALTGLVVDLKWPNDLLIQGKKVRGILTDMHAEPTQVRFVIVGIGLNVKQETFPGELSNIATSLRAETGKPQSRMELLVRLLREFESDYNRFLREGVASVVARFESVSSYAKGKRVRVTNGTESYVGTTAGLGPEGLVQVEREDGRGTAAVLSGGTGARYKLAEICVVET